MRKTHSWLSKYNLVNLVNLLDQLALLVYFIVLPLSRFKNFLSLFSALVWLLYSVLGGKYKG